MVVEDLRVGHAGIFGMLKEMGITVPGLEAKLLKAKLKTIDYVGMVLFL